MSRRRQSPKSDRRWFRQTADWTRSVNTSIVVPRGGIRF